MSDDEVSTHSDAEIPEAYFDVIPKLEELHGRRTRANDDDGGKRNKWKQNVKGKSKFSDFSSPTFKEINAETADNSACEKKYPWMIPGTNKVTLRSGYEVYADRTVLEDLQIAYGPQKQTLWHKYLYRLAEHLIGDWQAYLTDRPPNAGVEKMFGSRFSYAIVGMCLSHFEISRLLLN